MGVVDVKMPSDDEEFDSTAEVAASDTSSESKTDEAVKPQETSTEEMPSMSAEPETVSAPEKKPTPMVVTDVAPAAVSETKAEPTVNSVKSSKPAKSNKGMIHFAVDALLVLLLIAVGLWGWSLHSDNQNLNKQVTQLNANPQAVVQKQTEALIAKVSALMTLPSGETPTIAEVSDASAAKKQSAFFNNAQNGDKVLMYAKAGQAILYRPTTGKIILVAPLTFTK